MSIQIKRGSTNSWITQNPVLLEGQPGLENREGGLSPWLKFGDSNTQWTDLPYAAPDLEIYTDTGIVFGDSFRESTSNMSLGLSFSTATGIYTFGNIFPDNTASGSNNIGSTSSPYSSLYVKSIGGLSVSGILKSRNGSLTQVVLGTDYPSPYIYQWTRVLYNGGSNFKIGLNYASLEMNINLENQGGVPVIYPKTVGSVLSKMTVGTQQNPFGYVYIVGRIRNQATDTVRANLELSSTIPSGSSVTQTGINSQVFSVGNGKHNYLLDSSGFRPISNVGSVHSLGSADYSWNNVFIGDIQASYNFSDECLEFLVS